jgi:Phage integrase, N-terminal SAM-like domain
MTALAPLLQAFFAERLARQRGASPHTIAAYRDGFRLLLGFLHQQTGQQPSKLGLEDLDAERIAAFLAHLEHDRGNSVRTRNARLTAIHSFFRFAALKAPEQAELIARVLDIPEKRFDTTLISYLTDPRSTRCWPRPTAPPGPVGATTRCCCSRSRPGCESPSSRACAAKTSNSRPAPGSGAKAKAGKKGARHSPARPFRSCASGYASATASQPARCSPAAAAGT